MKASWTGRVGPALLLALLLPTNALANAAAPSSTTPSARSGVVARDNPLIVEREVLEIDCSEVQSQPDCRFRATYRVLNPTRERQEVSGLFYSVEGAAVDVTFNGRDARFALGGETAAAIHQAAAPLIGDEHARTAGKTGFTVALAAGGRGVLEFSGPLAPVYRDNPRVYRGFALPAVTVRHLTLGGEEARDADYRFEYLLAPILTWGAVGQIDVTLRVPSSWDLAPSPLGGRTEWRTRTAHGVTTATAELNGAADLPSVLGFRATIEASPFLHGGPLVGAGARLDTGNFAVRAGYEVAAPSWLTHALWLDYGFEDSVILSPLVTASTPNIAFAIPALGIGLGVPVELGAESVQAGARAELQLSWPFVSLSLPIDWLPGSDDAWRFALYGVLSL